MSEHLSASTAPAVDEKNPWLGLASFTEETRGYFYGREDEVAELSRRVQRKLLTVLFGQSGLGKTSILRAGLVPRLRSQGYCPVYVRIAYGPDAPEPADQIKQAIAATARRAGTWTQAGVAVEGESLWEFLHHRDDQLVDEAGNTQVPLVIFDQFEEIFTLAQTDDFGRARAARFIADLADLVENRPPKALEARLDADDAAADQFDFARSDYRVLIALREDYLAPLEGLKTAMPSITQNRLRLAPMTGTQALSAVMLPGKRLVSEDVAAAIVRFVAGGAEIVNAEVEPSLLSLICRELNDTRITEGRPEISLDLLAGSHASILSNFYERALADQPAPVRRVIEDELLTESGFRENVAEERLRSDFAAAGAVPDTVATLVNRRLLRIEERLDVRRVELTHDVLCPVVKASRDVRKEREARDATERLLQEQKEREQAARRALVRARQIASACIALAVVAVLAAGYAYVSSQRARRAEAVAQETRATAERARTEAEHLLGYLNDDFATELEGIGRLGLVLDLGKRELDYYNSLPKSLQSKDTISSRALAEVRYGIALQFQSRLPEAEKVLTSAIATLRRLRAEGDVSERTAIGLSLGLGDLGDVQDREGRPGAIALAKEAVDILKPYYDKPNASVAVRRNFGGMSASLGTYLGEQGDAPLQLARDAFASIGGKDLSDIHASAYYAYATSFLCNGYFQRGEDNRVAELANEAEAIAARVLEIRPGHLVALRAHAAALGYLSTPPENAMQIRRSSAVVERAAADMAILVQMDPTNTDDRRGLTFYYRILSDLASFVGDPRTAVANARNAVATALATNNPSPQLLNLAMEDQKHIAVLLADLGEAKASGVAFAEAQSLLLRIRQETQSDTTSMFLGLSEARAAIGKAEIDHLNGNETAAHDAIVDSLSRLSNVKGNNVGVERYLAGVRVDAQLLRVDIEMSLKNFEAAEQSANAAADIAKHLPIGRVVDRENVAQPAIYEAIALARLGKNVEASRALAPALALHRDLYRRNHDFEKQRFDYAIALYADALADPSHRAASLNESARILRELPVAMQALMNVKRWQQRVAVERAPH